MTTATIRELPDGYTDQHDSDVWNVGHVFRWSNLYDTWLYCGVITVKPNATIKDAYEDFMAEPIYPNCDVFFAE
jgi:hypothetical protein